MGACTISHRRLGGSVVSVKREITMEFVSLLEASMDRLTVLSDVSAFVLRCVNQDP